MSNLNGEQFAKYSSIKVPDKTHEYRYDPLPASMERHAPGEYQPTLPGMEKMLKGEATHTDVLFNHPNQAEKFEIGGKTYDGDIPGSNWYNKTTLYNPEDASVRIRSLRPVQDWVDDNHLHEEPHKSTQNWYEGKPLVERIGKKNVLQDGHHRVARARLAGDKNIDVARWG